MLCTCKAAELLEEMREPRPLHNEDAIGIHSRSLADNVRVHAGWEPRSSGWGVRGHQGTVQIKHDRQVPLHIRASSLQ